MANMLASSSSAVRNASRRLYYPSIRCLSSSTGNVLPASGLLSDQDSRKPYLLPALCIATTLALTSSAVCNSKKKPALAEGIIEEEEEEDESTKILNWSGTHSVELQPNTYHEPVSINELTKLNQSKTA